MIVALTALFAGLSGVAVAGTGLISGSQIKDHTITFSKLSFPRSRGSAGSKVLRAAGSSGASRPALAASTRTK